MIRDAKRPCETATHGDPVLPGRDAHRCRLGRWSSTLAGSCLVREMVRAQPKDRGRAIGDRVPDVRPDPDTVNRETDRRPGLTRRSRLGGRRVSRRGFMVGSGALIGAGLGGAAVAARLWASSPVGPGAGRWSELVPVDGVAPIHASLLPSGEILMAGEDRERGGTPNFLIDPSSGPIRVAPMDVPMRDIGDSLFCAGHAHMADGRMLQVGGSARGGAGLRYGFVFSEGTEPAWTAIDQDLLGGLAWYPTVTRMVDGSMLVISGFVDFGLTENRTIQRFDPASFDAGRMPWELLAPHRRVPPDVSPSGSDYTHTFVLPRPVELDGHRRDVVMIGWTGEVSFVNWSAPFDDPWKRFATKPNGARPGPTGRLSAAGASSVLLADGRILMTGGGDEDGTGALPLTDIYDPYRDTWRTIDMGIARAHPAAVLLPDATVLVVNGNPAPGELDDTRRPQIIDPVNESVTNGPAWPDDAVRGYHNVAVLLPDARILVAGGEGAGEGTERPDMRYYSPPYLSVLAPSERPRIRAAPTEIAYAEPFRLSVDRGPVHRVTLLGLGSMTHAFDSNQRCVVLFSGEATDRAFSVEGPQDAYAAPPGDYLLFVLRRIETERGDAFVPSIARVVRVTGPTASASPRP